MSNVDRALPYGWIKQHDSKYDRDFWVDTKATPPRSIWVHPYEDDQYLREHPDVREKVRGRDAPPGYAPPTSVPPGASSSSSNPRDSYASVGGGTSQNRSLFGKVKDGFVGLKEEREASLARIEEERRQRFGAASPRGNQYGQGGYQGQGSSYQHYPQQQYQQGPPQGYYGGPPPQQGYYGGPPQGYYGGSPYGGSPYGGGYGGQPQVVQAPAKSSHSAALPLIGGLAGGLLLGEALDGFGGDGGDGGGDFGGDGGDGGGDF